MIGMLLGFMGTRLGGGIAAAVVAVLLLALGVQTVRLAGVHHDVAKLTDSIERPITGYQDRLKACQEGKRTLERAIAVQNAAIADLNREGAIRTAAAERAVTDALKGRASAEARAAKLLNTPPAGIDACARAMSAFDAVKGSLQ